MGYNMPLGSELWNRGCENISTEGGHEVRSYLGRGVDKGRCLRVVGKYESDKSVR